MLGLADADWDLPLGYELSARSSTSLRAGTPERPLSDLGLRGYLQFWTSVLIRYFRLIFYTRNDPRLVVPADFLKERTKKNVLKAVDDAHADDADPEAVKLRLESEALAKKGGNTLATDAPAVRTRSRKNAVENGTSAAPVTIDDDTSEYFAMKFSLAEIANATHLRDDDVAFALVYSGLARYRTPARRPARADSLADTEVEEDPTMVASDATVPTEREFEVVIAPALIEEVATRMKVKTPVLVRSNCLL